jgi:hypothetical protein
MYRLCIVSLKQEPIHDAAARGGRDCKNRIFVDAPHLPNFSPLIAFVILNDVNLVDPKESARLCQSGFEFLLIVILIT